MKSTTTKQVLSILGLGLMGLAGGAAQATWNHDRDYRHEPAHMQNQQFSQAVNARLERQMQRIQAGFRNGALTHREYRNLMREQADIREMERHFRSDDGRIDWREFKRLERALDIASMNIRSEKHDRQARNTYSPHFW
ncbi:MAG: hypothetical protein ACK4R8_09020 [Thiobacillus sp.]